jgi:hypothetical protein
MAKGKTIVYITDDETAFLNVDVDVFAKYPLEPLAAVTAGKEHAANMSAISPLA